jgi:hypothetical protein
MKTIFITVIAFSFVTGCSEFLNDGGSVGSSAGSSGNSTGSVSNSSGGSVGGSSAASSGGSSAGSSGGSFAGRTEEVVLEQKIVIVDTRGLIPVVNAVKVDKYSGGAIITARGTTDIQGYSNVHLVARNSGLPDENGVVTYDFKAELPVGTTAGPTPRSNEVYAGTSITALRLPSVKRIRVIAGQNEITVSK